MISLILRWHHRVIRRQHLASAMSPPTPWYGGLHPQPYKDAVERFEKLYIGGINYGCWKAMLLVVQGHTAFSHEQKLINRTTDNLVKCLIVEPNFKTIGHAD